MSSGTSVVLSPMARLFGLGLCVIGSCASIAAGPLGGPVLAAGLLVVCANRPKSSRSATPFILIIAGAYALAEWARSGLFSTKDAGDLFMAPFWMLGAVALIFGTAGVWVATRPRRSPGEDS